MKARPTIDRMCEIARRLRRGRFIVAETARDLDVSKKTIHRDLDFMRDRLGHRIVFRQDIHGQRWLYESLPECFLL